ncbi:MAG: urease accessory protein UreD [Congregibacter sp.]|nr:urease accessory protein UreD [Congregibacter sp.]
MLLEPIEITADVAGESSKAARHWRARLELSFAENRERTGFVRCWHEGPLRVQRLFYPESTGKAHCYLLHPPGGVVLGDELQINVHVQSGEALITTPSAGRFYNVGGHSETQQQSVHLRVDGGKLEWLPQETILFDGANARLKTRVDLAGLAQLAFWDVIVLGRPACGEAFSCGRLEQSLEIYRDEQPLLIERLALSAGDRLSQSRMGMQGHSTFGIMVLTQLPDVGTIDQWLIDVNAQANRGDFTVTQRGSVLVARYLGENALRAREGFIRLWSAAAEQTRGIAPAIPRIWHT